MIDWKVERRKVKDLKLYPKNPRKIDEEKIDRLKKRIQERGFHDVIKIDQDNVILSGNQRRRALQDLGIDEIDVKVPTRKLTDKEREQVLLESNIQEGEWDEDILKDFDDDLLVDIGLDDFTFKDDVEVVEDEVPEPPKEAKTKLGDLYKLGEHRLLCGDSTNPQHVELLLQNREPYLMVTDPPYGVSYEPNWRNEAARYSKGMGNRSIGAGAVGKVSNDDKAEWRESWSLSPSRVAYVWHAGKFAGIVQESLEVCDYEIRSQIIWSKSSFPISRGDYHWKHEPCWYAVKKGNKGNWAGDRKQTTVWNIDKPQKSDTGHSTQKPVECMLRPIKNHDGDVYDPFGGSGTTLIACEQLKRKCYMMEIDPIYCDVIVERWEKLTGKKAELLDASTKGK